MWSEQEWSCIGWSAGTWFVVSRLSLSTISLKQTGEAVWIWISLYCISIIQVSVKHTQFTQVITCNCLQKEEKKYLDSTCQRRTRKLYYNGLIQLESSRIQGRNNGRKDFLDQEEQQHAGSWDAAGIRQPQLPCLMNASPWAALLSGDHIHIQSLISCAETHPALCGSTGSQDGCAAAQETGCLVAWGRSESRSLTLKVGPSTCGYLQQLPPNQGPFICRNLQDQDPAETVLPYRHLWLLYLHVKKPQHIMEKMAFSKLSNWEEV